MLSPHSSGERLTRDGHASPHHHQLESITCKPTAKPHRRTKKTPWRNSPENTQAAGAASFSPSHLPHLTSLSPPLPLTSDPRDPLSPTSSIAEESGATLAVSSPENSSPIAPNWMTPASAASSAFYQQKTTTKERSSSLLAKRTRVTTHRRSLNAETIKALSIVFLTESRNFKIFKCHWYNS